MAKKQTTIPTDISWRVEKKGLTYDPLKYAGRGGVYSDLQILGALADGHIRIYPFVRANLKGTSYDVRLGEWFYLTDKAHNRQRYNPYDPGDVKRYFGEPLKAVTNREWAKSQDQLPFKNIPLNQPIIVLNPGERILAHTYEFIGIRPPGTTQMQARSTFGRNGVVVCKDAGWGDPGYIGRWTMEIQNDNTERIVLPVGARVAQLVFLHAGESLADYGKSSKYYKTRTLADDIKEWQPSMMLPQAFKDEIKPLGKLTLPK